MGCDERTALLPGSGRDDGRRIRLKLTFEQYELKVLYLPGTKILTERIAKIARAEEHNASWEIEYPDGVVEKSEGNIHVRPENHTGPGFYGKLIYRTNVSFGDKIPDWLYLGALSDCCEVFLNGGSLGKRAAALYLFAVSDKVKEGENQIEIEVYTSASNSRSDHTIFGIPVDSFPVFHMPRFFPWGFSVR